MAGRHSSSLACETLGELITAGGVDISVASDCKKQNQRINLELNAGGVAIWRYSKIEVCKHKNLRNMGWTWWTSKQCAEASKLCNDKALQTLFLVSIRVAGCNEIANHGELLQPMDNIFPIWRSKYLVVIKIGEWINWIYSNQTMINDQSEKNLQKWIP